MENTAISKIVKDFFMTQESRDMGTIQKNIQKRIQDGRKKVNPLGKNMIHEKSSGKRIGENNKETVSTMNDCAENG